MTPDPDPPAPTGKYFYFQLKDGLSNAHMIRICDVNNSNELLTWTRIDNVDYIEVLVNDIPTPSAGEPYRFAFYTKGYNNSYSDGSSSYYDDSTLVTFSGSEYVSINANAQAGNHYRFDISGSTGTWSYVG